jgi:hypothetical protein
MWKNPRCRAADFVRRCAVDFARGLAVALARAFVLVFNLAAVAVFVRGAFRALRMVLRAADFLRAVAILHSSGDCTADDGLLSRDA